MAGKRSRAQSHEADEDDERSREETGTPESNASKRARTHQTNGHFEEQDDEVEEPVRSTKGKDRAAAQMNGDEEEFQPGSIRRVKLENFTTYEHAEFFPGPSLNMVLGPNGTGKSSLVCAICLGLGYNTNVLGRASAFGEFVKYGKKEAVVEVELQRRPKDSQNFVVTLRIDRDTNKREFLINGRPATHKQVVKLNSMMRIQIDNLCQFLPQDKVAEFAALSPVDLLAKTLQAAAPPEMLKWQDELKALFASQAEFNKQLETDNGELKRLETRQESLQGDVEKIRERERLKHEVDKFKAGRHIPAYQTARTEYSALKRQLRDLKYEAQDLQEKFEPSLKGVYAKEAYMKSIEQVVTTRERTLRHAEDAADAALNESEVLQSNINGIQNKIEVSGDQFTAKKKELGDLKRKVHDLETRHKQKPAEFSPGEWNTRIREQEHRKRETRAQISELSEKARGLKSTGEAQVRDLRKIKEDIATLDSVQGQLRNHLKRIFPDGARGMEWLEQNKGLFEKEVFGPPMLTCSLKDERYSDLVQSVLGRDDFLCFTAQTAADHKKLSHYLFKELRLTVSVRSTLNSYDSYRNPYPREQLRAVGLDGYATDYLDGPEPVLAMLCGEKRLHCTGVGLNAVSDEQYQQLDKMEAISQFAAGKNMYRVTRRKEYGANAASTRVRQIQRGQFWTDQPVDTAEKTELNRKLEQMKAEVTEVQAQFHALRKEQIPALEAQYQEINEKEQELRKQKGELQAAWNKWNALPDKIEAEKKNLEQKMQDLRDLRKAKHALDQQLDREVMQQAEAALRHRETIDAIRVAHQDVLEARLRLIEAKSDWESLKDDNRDMQVQLEQAKARIEALDAETRAKKEEATKLQRLVSAAVAEYEAEDLPEFIGERTIEQVDAEITARETRLNAIEAQNPHALREFERLIKDIDRLKAQKTRREEEFAETAENITRIRAQFEPKLDDLVGQINTAFSYNFEQINCAGEVDVYKDESDFENWAIQIKVRFRPGETLQILNQHRQSGGERAVSTIFYLMSLQAMAQAPFRVVDEINQGMDPRNERMVHERMVEIACREHTSQYFLITPKLLTDLRYDARMTVHCIASGETVPSLEDRRKQGVERLDFAECVRIQARQRAARAYPTPEPAPEEL